MSWKQGDAMTLMSKFMNHASFGAMDYAVPYTEDATSYQGVEGLAAIQGESLLGEHDGVFDDALMADLRAELV